MATHSSVLAWRIPGTGEPGGLPSMGSHRVRHDKRLSSSSSSNSDQGSGKESAYNEGDSSSIPGLGRSSGDGNGYPLQYSCLENSMDRGAWRATVHGVTKESDTTEQQTLSLSEGHLRGSLEVTAASGDPE